MIPKYTSASGLGIAVLLGPAYALACGDPGLIFIIPAIVVCQVMLAAVFLLARRNTLRDRIKVTVLYLISVIALWIANELIHGWSGEQSLTFDYVRLLGGAIVSGTVFRYTLAKK